MTLCYDREGIQLFLDASGPERTCGPPPSTPRHRRLAQAGESLASSADRRLSYCPHVALPGYSRLREHAHREMSRSALQLRGSVAPLL
ncbi:hypothetical protein K466DRAFT_39754 [Polyporus arcularius HHB13444]|uniref:Uncharacterized protein n=1 Tax=Polyporus arcularius HHB13444 TaxID=1314778 RepID=A0A5C3PIR2_9APHY|nr:hypothetical protein K466DRAFT_39754 [Polyporus arcularius HHB13444]